MTTSRLITRRRAIVAGLASVGGLVLARSPKELPPTYGNLLRMGDTLTYAAHRALLPGESLAREFDRSAITSFPAIGTTIRAASVKSPLGQATRPSRPLRSPTGGCRSRASWRDRTRSRSPS